MKRRIFGLILIVPILCQSISYSLIYSGYLLNKAYLSANLCENKNAPEKHCEAKCLLKKNLKSEEEKENSAPASVKKGSEVVYLFIETLSVPHALSAVSLFSVPFTEHYYHLILSGIFHPPRA